MPEKVIATARFDPKLRVYLYLQSLGLMAVTVIGLVVFPFWMYFGWRWAKRHYGALRCELTERRLRIHRGVWFQKDKTIPLEKIQDLSLQHGPLQRWLGICTIRIETAGQSGPQNSADAALVGIVDVHGFQEKVLAQRDLLESRADTPSDRVEAADDDAREKDVLVDMRDTLRRIERHLQDAQHRAEAPA